MEYENESYYEYENNNIDSLNTSCESSLSFANSELWYRAVNSSNDIYYYDSKFKLSPRFDIMTDESSNDYHNSATLY